MIRRARRPPSPIFHACMTATAERAGLASPPVAADKIYIIAMMSTRKSIYDPCRASWGACAVVWADRRISCA